MSSAAPPGPLDVAASLLVYRSVWPRPQQARLVLHRLGLGSPGARPSTLAAVGKAAGYTASWVGHLERRARAVASRVEPPPPLLGALHLLGAGPPRPTPEAALRLFDAGLVRDIVHPASVAAVATLFGVPVPYTMLQAATRTLVVPHSARPTVRRAEVLLYRQLRRGGFADLAELERPTGLPVDVLTVLVDRDRRLTRHAGVVWRVLDHPSHLLPRTLDRMLAVGPQTVETLRQGLALAWRYLADVRTPDGPLLHAYLASQERYRLDGDRVSLADPSTARPTRVDQALITAYGTEGRAEVTTQRLREHLIAAGVAAPGVSGVLATSPLLERTRPAHYRLRTSRPD